MEVNAMKNKIRILFRIMKVTIVCICISACSGQTIKTKATKGNLEIKTKTACQIPASDAVLEGSVTIEGDRIISCEVDEFNTMLIWGNFSYNNITKEEITKLGDDNIQTALFKDISRGQVDTRFAKYVQVGDVILTAGVDSKGFIFYTSYKTGNVISYFEKSEDNIAWYIKQISSGNFWILKKTGDGFEKLDLASFYQDNKGDKLEKGKSQNKRWIKHWEGYLPNITKIENFFIKNGFIEGEFKQRTDGVWAIADAVTGATIEAFGGYAGVLYKAYKK
jgi:hypothetical protein